MTRYKRGVRFGSMAGFRACTILCPLCSESGHFAMWRAAAVGRAAPGAGRATDTERDLSIEHTSLSEEKALRVGLLMCLATFHTFYAQSGVCSGLCVLLTVVAVGFDQ